jgi:hypothetical protein
MGNTKGDPYAHLDGRDPFEALSDGERAALQASIAGAEQEIAAGEGMPVEEFLSGLRAAR